jgi:hypothetical protein
MEQPAMLWNTTTERTAIMPMRSNRALWLCTAVLAAACASASLVFACATPFAAFAVLAAAMLPVRQAFIAVGLSFAVNQAIGYGILGYPHDLNAALWGGVMLGAALLTTAAASAVFRRFAGANVYAVYPVALLAAYAVYEIALLALVPVLGGGDSFTAEIVAHLAFVNAVWLAGLVAVYELLRRLDVAGARQRSV